jgi:single-stranded-DNA-specific exonuclease
MSSVTRPRWIEPPEISPDLPRLHPDQIMHELLVRRGLDTPERAASFLDRRRRHAPNTRGLPNLEAAVERIGGALEREERIAIFGDYDADGITATALLTKALRAAAANPNLISPRLPTRDEGYGLNRAAIDDFHAAGATLMIAVDCGSSDQEQVAYARSRGMDVVVLDHHQLQGESAVGAIIVSAQLEGGGAFTDLSAVGVAFVLVAALAREGHRIDGNDGEPETGLLDLVALGTIADMVPIDGINRALVRDGLRVIAQGKRRGIVELCRKSGINTATVTADQVVYKLAPRINAAGRMGDPQLALALLLEDDPLTAARVAGELEALNDRRKAESARVHREAEMLISLRPELIERPLLVLSNPSWPGGLLGPLASQLVERYRRPVVVLRDSGEQSLGSARSVPGFDVTAALERASGLLTRYGGHGQASGMTLPSSRLPELTAVLESALVESGVPVPFQPELRLDADLPGEKLTITTVETLDLLQPFGVGNEQPLLRIRDVAVRKYDVVGADRSHLRIQLGLPTGTANAIAFGMAGRSRELIHARRIDIAAMLRIDEWNGRRRMDVEIRDFHPADG